MQASVKSSFSNRLSEICDDMAIPAERGRQTRLAQVFGVTPNAARKWLLGEGLPALELAVSIANWADVNVNWLVQGTGPKRGDRVETKALVLNEVIEAMPVTDSQQVLDFIRYKIERSDPLAIGERMARYMAMLDAFSSDMERKRRK